MLTFYDLPRPIRETVYRHALVTTRIFIRPLISMTYLLDPTHAETHTTPNLPLLRTSRKIYAEANPIYLSENIFSIVQVDLLAAARMENRRVAKNLQCIRKLELVFDHRDYKYLARFLESEGPAVMQEIDDWADESPFKGMAMRELGRMCADFDMDMPPSSLSFYGEQGGEFGRFRPSSTSSTISTSPSSLSSSSSTQYEDEGEKNTEITPHDRQITNMKEYLWGRTLTFIRQTFLLTHLYIDMRRCSCPRGCCRLADQVLDWGWMYVWIHGLPNEVQVRGSSRAEKEVIARSLDRQSFRSRLRVEDVFDQRRVMDYRGVLQYNALLRSVQTRLGDV